MTRKRKSDATRLDEVDRTLYSTFCGGANSLSQLYSQSMSQQKLSFQAGERHALEKLYQWILRQHEEESRVTVTDIVAHIQSEIEYGGDDATVSPVLHLPNQMQSAMQFTNPSNQPSSGLFGQAAVGVASRVNHSDQSRNSVFSNALSSPVRRSLQPFQVAQGGGYFANGALPTGNADRDHEFNSPSHNRESNFLSSNDSSMDMHSDSPTMDLIDPPYRK